NIGFSHEIRPNYFRSCRYGWKTVHPRNAGDGGNDPRFVGERPLGRGDSGDVSVSGKRGTSRQLSNTRHSGSRRSKSPWNRLEAFDRHESFAAVGGGFRKRGICREPLVADWSG